jgi:hypothetical protein
MQKKINRPLREQNPVTFRTEIFFPAILYIYGVNELHRLIDMGIFHILGRTLCNESMAKITILRNDLPLITFHTVIMTTETTIGFEVADMVQIAG